MQRWYEVRFQSGLKYKFKTDDAIDMARRVIEKVGVNYLVRRALIVHVAKTNESVFVEWDDEMKFKCAWTKEQEGR